MSNETPAVTGAAAERLYNEAQAIMRRLPGNIGKAKRDGKLSARQLASLARLDEIEKVLPTTGPEWRRIMGEHRARIERQRAEHAATRAADERRRLAAAGLAEGDKVYAVLRSMLPYLGGRRLDGVVRIAKDGTAYVAAGRKRYDPFRNPWKKVERAPSLFERQG